MNIKSILLASTLLATSLTMSAQMVNELCQSHVRALGGKTMVNAIRTLKITQVGTLQGTNMPMITILIPGKAYYQKIRTSMGTMVSCVYGTKGWTYSSYPQLRTTSLSEPMAKSMLIQSKFYGPLYDYYVNGDSSDVKSITKLGMENIDREKCYHLEVIYKSGYKANVYLSSHDYMIYKVVSPTGVIKYGNYKKMKGVMIPRYIEIINGRGNITAIVSKININSEINNVLFTRP